MVLLGARFFKIHKPAACPAAASRAKQRRAAVGDRRRQAPGVSNPRGLQVGAAELRSGRGAGRPRGGGAAAGPGLTRRGPTSGRRPPAALSVPSAAARRLALGRSASESASL